MRTNISKFIGIGFAVMLMILAGFVLVCLDKPTSVFAIQSQNVKAYEYVILADENHLKVVGKYENGGLYTVSQGQTLETVISAIDYDRLIQLNSLGSNDYHDAKLTFNNITVGDHYLTLKNGNYTICGSLTGRGYLTSGLIYVNGASVTFENANISNYGLSYLVRNDGNGDLVFNGGEYVSNATTILSKGSGNVSVMGANITSHNSACVEFLPNLNLAQFVVGEATKTSNFSANAEAVVTAKGGMVVVLDGNFVNKSYATAFNLTNAKLFLANAPTFSAGESQIITNSVVSGKNIAKYYAGQKLTINYTGEIVSGETVIVENYGQADLFELLANDYVLESQNNNLVAHKVFTVRYKDPTYKITVLPTDREKYKYGEQAQLKFADDCIFPSSTTLRYEFVGWSESLDASTPTYTETGASVAIITDNLILYPVWQAIEFTITYSGVDDIGNNPQVYNTDQTITFENPSKQFYVFSGWKLNGMFVGSDFTLQAGGSGDIVLEAVWTLEEYAINYHNLPSEAVLELNLQTSYNINSPELNLNLEDVLYPGYAFYGIFYDQDFTKPMDAPICFSPENLCGNSENFESTNAIGQPINIYVNLLPYFNGTGNGTKENPFMLDDFAQLKALVSGTKLQTEKLFVNFENNITYNQNLAPIFTGLEGFVIDGKNFEIRAEVFTNLNQTLSLFPSIKNCELKNLKIDALSHTFETEKSLSIGVLAGTMAGSKLENIEVIGNLEIKASGQENITTKMGLCIGAENTVFNEIHSKVGLTIKSQNLEADFNAYIASIVGFSASNCVFANIENSGNISVQTSATNFENRTYLSGVASLSTNNKIVNALVSGNVELNQETNNLAFVNGVAMCFNVPNKIVNVVVTGNLVTAGQTDFVQKSNFVGLSGDGVELTSAYTGQNLEANPETSLKQLNSTAKNLEIATGVELDAWYVDANGNVSFANGVVVTFVGGDAFEAKTLHFKNGEDAKNTFIAYNTNKYLFKGYVNKDNQPVNWAEMTSGSYTVYAEFITIDQWIKAEQTKAVLVAVLVFVLVLGIMFILDMPKTVRFVYKGQTIGKIKVGRTKKINLPEEFAGKMCFKDENGEHLLTKTKMPYYPLVLYVFDDDKQSRLEKFWSMSQENKSKKHQKTKTPKQSQKQKETSKKTQTRKKQLAKSGVTKKSSLTKTIGGKDAKITIIKKEVKTVKKPSPARKKRVKVLAEQINMFDQQTESTAEEKPNQ